MVIAVTGADGQVGQAIRSIADGFPDLTFLFWSRREADITNPEQLNKLFQETQPNWCINLAAYTAVDKAESEPDLAYDINASGAGNVASACKAAGTKIIHLSTDFVFDGTKRSPYLETDATNPLSVYGRTKLEGEQKIQQVLPEHLIVRASWIFSEYGNNFYKTMVRLGNEGRQLRIVNDQIGCPTYAVDLARALLALISQSDLPFGIYHFANSEEVTWFDFAKAIFAAKSLSVDITPISSEEFGAPAQRPSYSVLDTSKISKVLSKPIQSWREFL